MVGRDPKTGKVIPHKRNSKTAALVRQYVASGADENTVACLLNIRPGLLRQEYEAELRDGLASVNMEVIKNVLDTAKGSDKQKMKAAELWLRNRAGWDQDKKPVQDVPTLAIHIHS